MDKQGNIVGVGDIELQTRTTFENVRGILEAAGASMSDVVKMTVYVTDVADYMAKARHIRAEVFSPDFPSSTMIGVAALARPEFMVEVDAVAAVG
ncbi:MAG: 2-iminobutanoate/2-iminopropanoate deaminase [Chloroflexi bacterium]|nr:MAG: 2-iminobutanoate/2-iminopropanoate deaminase [Chloroflexota bacterium]